jgi:hypothetical protein
MISKTLFLLGLAAALIAASAFDGSAAFAQGASGGLFITIQNEYNVDLNFGPLGTGNRKGTDKANGMLTRQGPDYVGTFSADVDSTQSVSGLGKRCTGHYKDAQNLTVIGHLVNGFPLAGNRLDLPLYNVSSYTGSASNEYLMLEFVPETRTASQPRKFDQETNQLSVNCHDLIIPQGDDDEDDSRYATRPRGFDPSVFNGIAFLPLNDTRWTTKGQGYIIRLPTSGILVYRDVQVPGTAYGLLKLKSSVWTISVERQK